MKPGCHDARGTDRHSAFAFSGYGLGYVVIYPEATTKSQILSSKLKNVNPRTYAQRFEVD
jgi:hypothetical protein